MALLWNIFHLYFIGLILYCVITCLEWGTAWSQIKIGRRRTINQVYQPFDMKRCTSADWKYWRALFTWFRTCQLLPYCIGTCRPWNDSTYYHLNKFNAEIQNLIKTRFAYYNTIGLRVMSWWKTPENLLLATDS